MGRLVEANFKRQPRHGSGTVESDRPVPGYRLKIGVAFSDPLIWRTVVVPGTMTLARLHRVIQACLAWQDLDSHQFLVGKIFYQPGFGGGGTARDPKYDESCYQLWQLEEGMRFLFTYLYDGGDGWEVELAVESVLESGCETEYPVLVAAGRGCPPEEVGDIHQYQALLSGFEASDLGSADRFQLFGSPDFDPAFCDLDAINKVLSTI